jgi:acetyl-CoA synthetase
MSSSNLSAYLKARDFLIAHRDRYDEAYRDFRWPSFTHFNWALDYFDAIADGNSQLALWILDDDGSERESTYQQMSRRSNQVAQYLRALGVRRGDPILLMLGNEPALWESVLAIVKLGAVAIPATTMLTGPDLADRIERGGARHVIAGAPHTGAFEQVPGNFTRIAVGNRVPGWLPFEDAYDCAEAFTPDGPTKATDPLLLYFTSGTTAKPKIVQHSHQSYPVGHLSTLFWLGLEPGDVHWNISSPGWAKHSWSSFFTPWIAGATVFACNYSRFRAKRVLEILVEKKITTLCAPPTVWRMLVQEKLSDYQVSIRELLSAGEPLNPELIDQFRAGWNITIREGYGQTETTALVANVPGQPVKAGSMGRPLPGYRVAILDADDQPATEGELCLDLTERPVGLMIGYGEQAATDQATRGAFYRTGDVVTRDADDYITFVGRLDDVFKSSDYRISPFELESALIQHSAVAEAAVTPSPDPVRLSVPKGFIALAPGYAPNEATARSIFSFMRQSVAPYKRIRRLEFRDLPKTISGKIRRAELRESEYARTDVSERRALEFFEEDFTY